MNHQKIIKSISFYSRQTRTIRHNVCSFSSDTTNSNNHLRNKLNFLESKVYNDRVTVDLEHDSNTDGVVANIRLSRASKLNGLDMDMFTSIKETLLDLKKNSLSRNIRVVILHGDGKAFSTGLDVKSFIKPFRAETGFNNPMKNLSKLLDKNIDDGVGNLVQDVAYLWRDLPVPVIASLHGMCFGGALQIALAADMRYCTPDCKLSIMESKWGLIPDMTASITLRELIGIDVAKELTMTGRIINGTEAASLGLVTRCVDDPLEESYRVAKEILENSPDSVALAKDLFRKTWNGTPESECLEIETSYQKQLIGKYNQIARSSKNFGINLKYGEKDH